MKPVNLFLLILAASCVLAYHNFNVQIEISKSYKQVSAGEELLFTTKVANLGDKGRVDITLNYEIIDSYGQLKASKSETVAMETTASFVGNIAVPSALPNGLYKLAVSVVPVDSTLDGAKAESSFNIVQHDDVKQLNKKAYILIAGVAGMALLIYTIRKSASLIDKLKIRYKVFRIVKKSRL